MTSVALQRCWNHHTREAIARCPECSRSYCRECVVEHEDRIICSGCLAKLTAEKEKTSSTTWTFRPLLRFCATLMGILVAWLLYFSLGRVLLSVPDEWHADAIWEKAMSSFDEFQ